MSLRQLKGLKWPLQIVNGRPATSEGIEHLREGLAQIILTRPGEVPFLNNWGCRIAGRLFDPANARHLVEADVRKAVELYEPRAEITAIDIDSTGIDEGILGLRVEFRPKGQQLRAEAYIELGA